MKLTFLYPGSFCPPTYGHLNIANEIAKDIDELIIICSINKGKTPMFTPEQCIKFWKAYDLRGNIKISTLSDLRKKGLNRDKIVMIRGIRNDDDYQYEKKVLESNNKEIGIDKFMLIFAKDKFKNISSSKVKQAVKDLDLLTLSQSVAPLIATSLLEKELDIKNLYIITGRPAVGKSEIAKLLAKNNGAYINADALVKKLRYIVENITKETEPSKISAKYLEMKKEVDLALREPLLKLLKEELKKVRGKENVFIEVPYALRDDNSTYKYLGGKIIYIYCDDEIIKERIKKRNAGHLLKFIDMIPSKEEAERIAKEKKLNIIFFDSGTRSAEENVELLQKELI